MFHPSGGTNSRFRLASSFRSQGENRIRYWLCITLVCSLPNHRLGGEFRKQEARVEVRLNHPIPIPWVLVEDPPEGDCADVVDQNIYWSQRLFNLLQGRLQLPTLDDIDSHGQRRNPQCVKLVHDPLVLLLIARKNGNRRSGLS